MEKSRNFWHSSRSILVMVALGILLYCPIGAKEAFDQSSLHKAQGLDYSKIKTVSFFSQEIKKWIARQ
jgi:hypothetical protein